MFNFFLNTLLHTLRGDYKTITVHEQFCVYQQE